MKQPPFGMFGIFLEVFALGKNLPFEVEDLFGIHSTNAPTKLQDSQHIPKPLQRKRFLSYPSSFQYLSLRNGDVEVHPEASGKRSVLDNVDDSAWILHDETECNR